METGIVVNGELVSIENLPIIVRPTEQFEAAKESLSVILESGKELRLAINSDDEYNRAIALLKEVKRFEKTSADGGAPIRERLNQAKETVMTFLHELLDPAEKLKTDLSRTIAAYAQKREADRLAEEARLREEAERERQRKQREADLAALHGEIQTSWVASNDALARSQTETVKEINSAIGRFKALESTPGAFQNPLQDAQRLRQAVATAIQHEQARVAAAKAREEGDKVAAKAIEKAAAKQEAPIVESVRSERVEAAPVVVPKVDLAKAKGSYVKETWKVKGIYSPQSVPREFCEPSLSLLNAYAKRMGENAKVPGVDFEKETKLAGVRS